MQTLTVVNQMLATLGETPLNSLEEPHTFRGACLSTLDSESNRIQSKGWWFNMEKTTLTPMVNGRIVLGNDIVAVRTPDQRIVQRGRYLYDLERGDYTFDSEVTLTQIRRVAFDELPESAAAYIAALAVLRFQSNYDSDTQKRRELEQHVADALVWINSDHTRNRRTNFITSNPRLARLKAVTSAVRRSIR